MVDDSALMRALISRMLRTDPHIEVIGVARDGHEAVERAMELKPDVVTLDIAMPEMDGLSALRELTRRRLGRVVMLSAQDDDDTVYAALAQGAVDFVPKPSGPISADIERLAHVITEKVRVAADVDQERMARLAQSVEWLPKRGAQPRRTPTVAGPLERVVAIGASTGGPPAVEAILSLMPPDLPVSFLVVQHLPGGFSQGLCRRLGRSSPYPVREAMSGERLEAGVVLVAPSGSHIEVVNRTHMGLVVKLLDGPPVHGVRPCVDLLFTSLARAIGEKATGIVLTGMGQDGAIGVAAIKQAGGRTLAQSEETSVVFGMPRAAIGTGAIDKVAAPAGIAREIVRSVRRPQGGPKGAGEKRSSGRRRP